MGTAVLGCPGERSSPRAKSPSQLNLVVIIVLIAMTAVLHRAHRVAILRMVDLNPGHSRSPSLMCVPPMAQLSSQIVAHEAVMIHMQPKIVVDAA